MSLSLQTPHEIEIQRELSLKQPIPPLFPIQEAFTSNNFPELQKLLSILFCESIKSEQLSLIIRLMKTKTLSLEQLYYLHSKDRTKHIFRLVL